MRNTPVLTSDSGSSITKQKKLHIVKKGESLSSIAKQYGFGTNWQILYYDSANAALRQLRPNPNIIKPGDHVFIPASTTPAQESTTTTTKPHTVKTGESLSSIAKQYGFETNWQKLYQAPENAELRKKRPNPNLIFPGDIIHIPTPQPPPQNTTKTKKHTDTLKRAEALSTEFIKRREEYIAWLADETRATWHTIAEWTRTLSTQDKKYRKLINDDKLKSFQEQHEREAKRLQKQYESKCTELIRLLKSQEFMDAFNTLAGSTPTKQYASLIQNLNQSIAGREFLLEELKTLDSQLSANNQATTHRSNAPSLLITALGPATALNEAFWAILTEYAPIIVFEKKKEAYIFLEALFVQYAAIFTITEDKRHALRLQLKELTLSITHLQIEATITEITRKTISITNLPVTQKIQGLMEGVFATFSLAISIGDLYKNPSTKESISTVGALAGLLDQSKRLTDHLSKKNLVKTTTKGLSVSALGIFSGICDTIAGGIDAWENYSEKDYDAMALHAVRMAGAATATIGSTLIFVGASTSWMGAGVVLSIAGLLVSAIAQIFAHNAEDSPLETWLRNSRFGINGDTPANKSWKDDPFLQLNELKKALSPVEFSITTKGGVRTLTIKPALMTEHSKALLSIHASWRGLSLPLMEEKTLNISSIAKTKDGQVTELNIPLDMPNLHYYFSLSVELFVDLYDDGKTMTYTEKSKLSL